MKRILVFSGLVLFVAGVLLMPAFHRLDPCHPETSEHGKTHDSYNCVICTVAATAVVVACVYIAVVLIPQPSRVINLPNLFLADLLISKSRLARAPPDA